MTEFERTTVRQSVDETVDPASPPVTRFERVDRPVVAATSNRQTVVRERSEVYTTGWSAAARAVGLIFGVLQALLVLRFVLLALGALQGNGIVSAILGLSDPFVEPFRGMFRIDHVAGSGSTLDVAALVALVGWTLIEILIVSILRVASRRAVWQP